MQTSRHLHIQLLNLMVDSYDYVFLRMGKKSAL